MPVLEAAVARNPSDRETRKLLALAYRWSDRLDEAERLSRRTLAEQPGDLDERNGLAIALLWQGRNRQAAAEFDRVLAARPDDTEALTAVPRAMEMDLPMTLRLPHPRRCDRPKNREAAKHLDTVRRRLTDTWRGRSAEPTTRPARPLEDVVGAHGRPARASTSECGDGTLFRQGSPERRKT